jgi:hypothetical protein
MTKRDLYWLAAGALGAAAIFGLYSWHGRSGSSASTGGSAASRMTTAAPVAPNSTTPAAKVASVEESTAKLAARLENSGGSREDWRLLGESYAYLGRKAEADAAYARAEGVPAPAVTPANAAPGGARITGTVEVASGLRAQADPPATLFIYAKSPQLHGMPLAVLRLPVAGWPVRFTLDDSNAMLPAQNLSSADWVTVEARISHNGNALAQPGDLIGSTSNISPRKGTAVRLLIDRSVGDERTRP